MKIEELEDEPLVRELALHGHKLTSDELDFLHEIGAQVIDRHRLLTERQRERAEKIYEERIAREL
jgi:hypothetical protein